MTWQVLEADCVEQMKLMDEASVDAVVTDPPAGISFMGRAWDSDRSGGFVEWLSGVMREALRVTKPGGHALVWALPRTSHWTGSAIEGAGWEIRDRITHHFGSGFPKSLDVSKAIDKAAGAEREVIGSKRGAEIKGSNAFAAQAIHGYAEVDVTAPATPEAQRWQGWGTALKPATEDWWLARKPLIGTVAQNVEQFGTGALNIDGCRIKGDASMNARADKGSGMGYQGDDEPRGEWSGVGGRWPANVSLSHLPECHDELLIPLSPGEMGEVEARAKWVCAPGCPVAELDRQSGERPGASSNSRDGTGIFDPGSHELQPGYGDTGGASRFFATFQSPGSMDYGSDVGGGSSSQGLDDTPENVRAVESSSSEQSAQATADVSARFRYVAKASRAERNAGLDGFEEREVFKGNYADNPVCQRCGGSQIDRGSGECACEAPDWRVGDRATKNSHPTVKPVELMRWLVRLVTPPGGTVLDPFAGSGTTGIACVLEDFDFIGIEREAEYVEIAKARIDYWAKQPKQLDLLDAA